MINSITSLNPWRTKILSSRLILESSGSITFEILGIGSRMHGDFARGLIFSLNIHEEGPGDIASLLAMLIFEAASRLFGACNERKVFFKFHKGSAG